jgi:putative aldouronate transport system substrate-binding protein
MPRFTPVFCMAVTEDSEHSELITRFFDFVFSPEGRMIVSYGIEGDSYELVDGKPVFTGKMYTQEGARNMFGTAAIGGRRIAAWPYDEAMLQQYKDTLALEAVELSRPYLDAPTPLLNFNGLELAAIESGYKDLQEKTSEYLLGFLTGELSVDESWDEYIAALKRKGLVELEASYNAAYARRSR